ERILDAERALMLRAGLRLDMQNSSQQRRRNSAPPPPKPRGGPSALAGGEEQAGQARRPTHALFARKVQRKLRNGVAGFAAAGSSLNQRVREGAGCWPPGPSCVSPAPQLKREWSPWPEFGWFPAISATFQMDNQQDVAQNRAAPRPSAPWLRN